MDSQQSYVPRVMRIGSTLGELHSMLRVMIIFFRTMLPKGRLKGLTIFPEYYTGLAVYRVSR
jgi:Na+-transporting NADH:ubiquinone oxidoreductase subunit NqrD